MVSEILLFFCSECCLGPMEDSILSLFYFVSLSIYTSSRIFPLKAGFQTSEWLRATRQMLSITIEDSSIVAPLKTLISFFKYELLVPITTNNAVMITFDHDLLTDLCENFSGISYQNWTHIVSRWLIWLKAAMSFIRMATTVYTSYFL